jgi:nucleotide-binding universal stress UspA family protein
MIARNEHSDSAQSLQRLLLGTRLSRRMEAPHTMSAAEPASTGMKPGWRIRTILVPTEFSARSLEAVARAAVLARHHDATVTILHVIDSNSPSAHAHAGTAQDLMRQLWATGIAGLRRLTESLAQEQTKVRARILEGLPAEVIIENSSGFDLLVIGEPCSKSRWNLFSRHTARRVIEGAACPVLVVHQQTDRVGPELFGTSLSLGALIAASAPRSV